MDIKGTYLFQDWRKFSWQYYSRSDHIAKSIPLHASLIRWIIKIYFIITLFMYMSSVHHIYSINIQRTRRNWRSKICGWLIVPRRRYNARLLLLLLLFIIWNFALVIVEWLKFQISCRHRVVATELSDSLVAYHLRLDQLYWKPLQPNSHISILPLLGYFCGAKNELVFPSYSFNFFFLCLSTLFWSECLL